MIWGDGSLSKLINDRNGIRFFAAGISNSQSECNVWDRMKESASLGIQIGLSNALNEMFVYFSTISIFLKDSPYTTHKKNMEEVVRKASANFTIIRLGNIWECTNPHTFINAYKAKPYEPRDEYKYMISKDQLSFITDNLPKTGRHEISIFGEMRLVKDALKR